METGILAVGEGGNVTLDVSPDLLRRQVTLIGAWTFSTVGHGRMRALCGGSRHRGGQTVHASSAAGAGQRGVSVVRPAELWQGCDSPVVIFGIFQLACARKGAWIGLVRGLRPENFGGQGFRASLRCRHSRRMKLNAQRLDDFHHGRELRVALTRQRFVQALARHPGITRHLRHTACACNVAKRRRDQSGVGAPFWQTLPDPALKYGISPGRQSSDAYFWCILCSAREPGATGMAWIYPSIHRLAPVRVSSVSSGTKSALIDLMYPTASFPT